MKRDGFTLVETLTVISITAVLTAVLTPVFASARRRAKVSSSLSVLHQLHVATILYQQDYGEGGYGDLPEMGLPNAELFSSLAAVSPTKSIRLESPCGLNPWWGLDGKQVLFQYVYRPGRGGAEFVKLIQKEEDRFVLFYDVNCDDSGAPVGNRYFNHLGLGVTLGGNAFTRRRAEDLHSDKFWAP